MSLLRGWAKRVKETQCLAPAVKTADTNCTAVDVKGMVSTAFYASMGAEGDTLSGSLYTEFEVEHSDDNSTFSDCADTDIIGAVTGNNTGCFAVIDAAAEAPSIHTVEYIGSKRYVRVVINVTGTHTNGSPYSVVAVQVPQVQPVA